jgi:TRAP-type C4-dicarboxylate transport system permease small subunit
MVVKGLKAFDRILTVFEEWTLFVAVMVALISLFVNVVLRYGFNYALAWSEELVREVIIYTTFIGSSVAIRQRSMIKIDASVQLLPRFKLPLTFFSHLATVIFALIMLVFGWKMALLQLQTMQKTIILEIPYVYLYAILPIMGGLMLIRTLQAIYADIRSLRHPDASARSEAAT